MCGFRILDNSTSKRVLDLLESVKLIVWKVVIERVTVIEFRMNNVSVIMAVLRLRYGWIQ